MFHSERKAVMYITAGMVTLSQKYLLIEDSFDFGRSYERVCLLIKSKVCVVLPTQEGLAKVNGNSRLNMYAKRLGAQ